MATSSLTSTPVYVCLFIDPQSPGSWFAESLIEPEDHNYPLGYHAVQDWFDALNDHRWQQGPLACLFRDEAPRRHIGHSLYIRRTLVDSHDATNVLWAWTYCWMGKIVDFCTPTTSLAREVIDYASANKVKNRDLREVLSLKHQLELAISPVKYVRGESVSRERIALQAAKYCFLDNAWVAAGKVSDHIRDLCFHVEHEHWGKWKPYGTLLDIEGAWILTESAWNRGLSSNWGYRAINLWRSTDRLWRLINKGLVPGAVNGGPNESWPLALEGPKLHFNELIDGLFGKQQVSV